MNFNLSQIPERTTQPRTSGLTMIMDKGLSINEVHNFMSVGAPHSDVIKLGFGTSFVTPNLKQKIEAYQSYNIPLYFGGTLFEAFLVRGQFDDYVSICKDYGITYIEVSDGSISIPHTEKCGLIEKLAKYGNPSEFYLPIGMMNSLKFSMACETKLIVLPSGVCTMVCHGKIQLN